MRLAIYGVGGYTGAHLADEAGRRGHEVLGLGRSARSEPGLLPIRSGSLYDAALLDEVASAVDTIAVAVPASSESGSLAGLVPTLLDTAARHGTRVGVVGGAGSLLVAPDGPALYDTADFPTAFRAGSQAQGDVLAALRSDPGQADWFYLSPAGRYGKFAPGERTGRYRVGGEVLLTDAEGSSYISGADYAVAFLDELEVPRHRRTRFTVAY